MTRFLILSLLAAWLGAHQPPVRAAGSEVDGLYRALVPVSGQAADERRDALGRALFDVLVKVSGQAPDRLRGALGASLEEPVRFVREYRYEPLRGTPAGLGLGVEFDKGAVDRLLRDAGLPVWGRGRPTTLVWLAEEDGASRRLIGPDERPALWDALRHRAAARGVPVVAPLLDIDDQRMLTAADLWGGFAEAVRAASARYGSDAILVGRLSRGSGGLSDSSWTLYRPETEVSWRLREGSLEDQAAAAVDRLTAAYARDFATTTASGGGDRRLRVEVTGLATVDQYARLMTFLDGLDAVRGVVPLALHEDHLELELATGLTSDRLRQALTLGALLRPISGEGVLRFELAP